MKRVGLRPRKRKKDAEGHPSRKFLPDTLGGSAMCMEVDDNFRLSRARPTVQYHMPH
jgi:hypothetical protein